LLPVEERPAPKSDIPGEDSWPTQPASTISVVPEKLTRRCLGQGRTGNAHWCADKIKAARAGEIYTPPSLLGTLVFPGNVAGLIGGAPLYDSKRHLLFVNTNRLPIL